MGVRLREKFLVETTRGNAGMTRNNGTPDTYVFHEDPISYNRRDYAMRDVTGSKGVFHPCSNVMVFRSGGTPAVYQEEVFFGEPPTYAYFGDFVGNALLTTALQQCPTDIYSRDGLLPSGEAQGFTRRAFNSLLDQMPETVSILNFLWELKDLKDAFASLKSAFTNPAGLFLAWQFGVAPTIRDIQKLLATAAIIRDKLEFLKKVNKRTVTISYVENFNTQNMELTKPSYVGHQPGWQVNPSDEAWVVEEANYKVQLNTSVHYDFNEDFESILSLLKATLAALGIGNPLKVIWTAIPFSFVVDWFFNVGTFLDGYDIQPFEGKITIEAASFSIVQYLLFGHLSKTKKSVLGPSFDEYQRWGSTQVFGYHRRHGTPEGDIDLTGLTPFQQLLAGALVLAQGKTFPTRRRI